MNEAINIMQYNRPLFTEWDFRFLSLAQLISKWSKDPSTQTGAVIVDTNRRVVSVGYNGFSKGVQDRPDRYNDRATKYKMVVHSEVNSIIFAHQSLAGYTLYTYPFMSCAPCAAIVIQSGINRCVAPATKNPRWEDDFEIAKMMFDEAGVSLTLLEYA